LEKLFEDSDRRVGEWAGPRSVPRSDPSESRWFRRPRLAQPRVRLFCIPYAGGNASLFRNWHDWLAPEVEVAAVELPGRGVHVREPLIADLPILVARLVEAMAPLLDLPFALFGHSMGAVAAFEVGRALDRRGRAAPIHIFLSGAGARRPHGPEASIHDLPDPAFLRAVADMGGTPPAVLENAELMELLLPVLRADFRATERHRLGTGSVVACPLTVFGGVQEAETDQAALEAWRHHTCRSCVVRLLPGDHFFIHEQEHLMVASIIQTLRDAAAG
jgi:medium-chain acyl-[acyl-carrier-protein] hydrolase